MYKAATIGCGARSVAHIDAYDGIDNAEVVACYAPSPRRREPLAETYGLNSYDDLEEMICKERPDMVHIITPPVVRVEVMKKVAELGVPLCTVEKPIATGVEDWQALLDLESRSETKFAVCHQVRWQENLVRCQKAVAAGLIGAVKFLDISAGMNIAGQGTHTLNYGRSLIGDPRIAQVFGNVGEWDTSDSSHPGSATTEAMLTFENGVRGLWTSGRVSPTAGDPQTVWQHVRTAAYGECGRVNFEEFGKWEIVAGTSWETGEFKGMSNWNEINVAAQTGFHQAMFAWLEEDEVPGTNLADSLHEWAVVLALYQSALTQKPIDLETFEPMPNLMEIIQNLH